MDRILEEKKFKKRIGNNALKTEAKLLLPFMHLYLQMYVLKFITIQYCTRTLCIFNRQQFEIYIFLIMSRKQQQWTPPPSDTMPKLKIFNSLTRRKETFVPQEGNIVKWYSCGMCLAFESLKNKLKVLI
jgi:hypothetical protein